MGRLETSTMKWRDTPVIFAAILLTGCDDGSYARLQRLQDFQTRYVNSCFPTGKEISVYRWEAGVLVCYSATNKFKPGDTQTPAVISSLEELP